MIRITTLLSLGCLAISGSLKAITPAVAEFTSGQKTQFSSANHAKAKGLNMTISYPKSWIAKEGDRPNILQKFVSNDGAETGLFMILIKSLPEGTTLSNEEAQQVFTVESLKDFVPEEGHFISGLSTKIEGLPAGILEFSKRSERAGMVFDVQTVSYFFFFGSNMVTIQCQVGGLTGSMITVKERMDEIRPLFTLIASSVVLHDKWK